MLAEGYAPPGYASKYWLGKTAPKHRQRPLSGILTHRSGPFKLTVHFVRSLYSSHIGYFLHFQDRLFFLSGILNVHTRESDFDAGVRLNGRDTTFSSGAVCGRSWRTASTGLATRSSAPLLTEPSTVLAFFLRQKTNKKSKPGDVYTGIFQLEYVAVKVRFIFAHLQPREYGSPTSEDPAPAGYVGASLSILDFLFRLN